MARKKKKGAQPAVHKGATAILGDKPHKGTTKFKKRGK